MVAMVGNLIKKIFGSRNERLLKSMSGTVSKINALESEIAALDDEQLRRKTDEFKQRYKDGASLDDLLPEAFAVVREAGKRVLSMRHFDVQLIGGMVLHQGKISEMRTGEGKTLVATLAAYLNALSGKGVHIVTVNDYLAKRDSEWMGRLYGFLGLTTGTIVGQMPAEEKREAYAADITYGTNNEFGFDYLRDNMAMAPEHRMQRELNFAIVDEVDSILIDEARTPLIISGTDEDSSELYKKVNKLIPSLSKQEEEEGPGDFTIEEKTKQVYLTEAGHEKVEDLLTKAGLLDENSSLYDVSNIQLFHHVSSALRAHVLYHKDVEYIVKNGEVIIVDEFTGRPMPGRRWSDGLHQAVEAKEGLNVQSESKTLASITFQNYFRLYDKLSGMTGTADTEAYEFQQIYGLEVVVIPTNQPMIRDDRGDLVYLTAEEKFEAIVEDILDCKKRGQPVLVGTTSIETSELISKFLQKQKIKHEVLNAKQHKREAEIVAQAGSPGAVTIATNMAGRGTDIVLGGNLETQIESLGKNADVDKLTQEWQESHKKVIDSGGLHIIGTERHESRRIDNQLRGRAGRQGDPGSSRFYLSMQDNLMRIFASERVAGMMQKLGMQRGESIEHPWISRSIENAQRKVEGHNFDIRKQLLEYDDVANVQRKLIYQQRNELMEKEDISADIQVLREEIIDGMLDGYIPPQSIEEQWDIAGLMKALEADLDLKVDIQAWLDQDHDLHEEPLKEKIREFALSKYEDKYNELGPELKRSIEKEIMLQLLDDLWKDHLGAMDHLRQNVSLLGYAQKNPKQEYKRLAYEAFSNFLERIKFEVVTTLFKIRIPTAEEIRLMEAQRMQQSEQNMQFQHDEYGSEGEANPAQPYTREGRKIGRNEPCPCGSGKKYKQCHGKIS